MGAVEINENRIVNAVIKSACLTIEDHGLLTAWLDLDYGGSGQGFGGYCLHGPKPNNAVVASYAGLFIYRVLQIVDVTEWSRLPGRVVRAEQNHSRVVGIGHVIRPDWFYPEREFAELSK